MAVAAAVEAWKNFTRSREAFKSNRAS